MAHHVACCGAATSSYWATNGPWSTGAGEARFMVNPPALVHRPQSWSMKDLVHLLLPTVRFTCTKCTDVWPVRGNSPCFFPGVLPPVVSSPTSLTHGAGVQFRWVKASPRYGKHNGEVEVTSRVPHGAGHGGGGSAVACRRRQGDVVAGSMLGGARELPVAPVNRAGETRRRQALPAVLDTVESKWLWRHSGRGAVWSTGVLRWPSSTSIASVACSTARKS